jgi:glycosyltransferase involved in cell wall biosynthesis/SAM-dependent methyltransferase
MFNLESFGYSVDKKTGVWSRAPYKGIAYSDGDDTELKISNIIRQANDLSALSTELESHCTDWPTLYHLSSARGNVLRPFEEHLRGSILEIGAGCGAISRYLGECGGQVLSLEGSPRRAGMAASRTRDLENVVVLTERFDDFETDQQFDAITLIGVLEYASMFSDNENPALGMLQQIRKLLKPHGKLFIAIENQLGLKYFAGAPEDHLGVPMYGIENRYQHGQPKTYGRKGLTELLNKSGFDNTEFLAPCPDYKLPNTIITERGFNESSFDAAALVSQNVKKDPQLPDQTSFNLQRAWPVIIENGIGMDFANSFLICASNVGQQSIPRDILAFHYSTGRRSSYCKEARFAIESSEIEVTLRRLANDIGSTETEKFRYILPKTEQYIKGPILAELFNKISATENWDIREFEKFFAEYIRCLELILSQQQLSLHLRSVETILPGRFIDAVPQNIVMNSSSNPQLIDIEWEMHSGVELGHLLMRACLLLIAGAAPLAITKITLTRREFIQSAFSAAGLEVTDEQLTSYIVREAEFQEKVTGKAAEQFLNWHPDQPVSRAHAPAVVDPMVEHLKELLSERERYVESVRVDYERQLSEQRASLVPLSALHEALSQVAEIRSTHVPMQDLHAANSKIEDLQTALGQKDTHIHHLNLEAIRLNSSISFKVTRPLRFAGRLYRKARSLQRLIGEIIYRNGGFKPTIEKSLKRIRTNGLGEISEVILRARHGYSNTVSVNNLDEIPEDSYAFWISQYDTLTAADRKAAASHIAMWTNKPLISILMPVYNPPLNMLVEAIESVQRQIYDNWELCIADDASTDPEVRHCLERMIASDNRVRVVFREQNGHISNATNSALDISRGEYVALMDNDDLIAEHALYWVARTIIENPDAALIYSDEDKIDIDGNRTAPYFKTDWNLYLFRSHNMISHLGVYKKTLVDAVGRFRTGMEGSQDYDLALRCSETLKDEQIIHIPRVLYHWRIHSGSTAMSPGEKPYAQIAGKNALDEHLQRMGIKGRTELLDFGMYRVHYDLPLTKPLVSLIIPTRNAGHLVKQCIDSIRAKTSYKNYEIILIDNGSDEKDSLSYFESLKELENVRIIRDDSPFNYSALNNRAVELADGELVGLINNDIEVINPDWLSEMVSLALQPNAGTVGARLWYPDNRLQHGGIIMGPLTLAGHAHKYMPKGHHGYFGRASLIQGVSANTAACLVVRKCIFNEVGGLNEIDLKIAFNDVDFCLKVNKAGYQNIWTPNADLYHHESATRGIEDTPAKRDRFASEVIYMQEKWKEVIAWDPAYNPNLSITTEDFSIAFPPRVNII